MRNYRYVARPPIENARRIEEQFRLAHAYQCALVAIERKRRAVIDRLYRQACPLQWQEHEAAEQATVAAVERVRRQRSTGGEMLEPDDDMKAEAREVAKAAREALEAARTRQKTAREAWYAAKRAVTGRLKRRLRMCDRGAYARRKRAYNLAGTVGLAWGTRLKIDESAERSGKAAQKQGTLPHFPRFDGGGSVVVQLQGGLDSALALGGSDTRFRLEVVDAARWQAAQGRSHLQGTTGLVKNGPRKGQPRQPLPQPKEGSRSSTVRQGALVHLRIGSVGREPIWATWPVTLGRPLPAGAPVKWAQVHARKVGARTHWELVVTVDDAATVPALRTTGPTLALNLGWRNLPDGGVRVGYAVGSDGRKEEVRVPPAFILGMNRIHGLRSVRDQRLEVLKRDLADWLDEGERPAWLHEALRYLDQWRSQKQAARLLWRWSTRRFSGDDTLYAALVAWVKQDRHLRFWECDERESLLRMRKDYYRTVAARWAREYARILVADMDLRDFATRAAPEDADKTDKVQRVTQRLAAPSELRSAVENACSTRGAAFLEPDGKFKTQTCHACGVVFAFAARQDLVHACECGAIWDQDENHDLNLLASDEAARRKAKTLAPTGMPADSTGDREPAGRWQRRRSKTVTQGQEITSKVG